MGDLSGWFLRPPTTGEFCFDPGASGEPPDTTRQRLLVQVSLIRSRLEMCPGWTEPTPDECAQHRERVLAAVNRGTVSMEPPNGF
jgi:hypothetical protein